MFDLKEEHRMKNHLMKLLVTGSLAALTLTGCGSGSLSGTETAAADGSAESSDLRTVTVGYIPIAVSAALVHGVDEGIFAKHGLNVELQPGQGGAAMLPAVSTGTLDFAIGNPLSVIVAADKGLDMRFVAGFSNSITEGKDVNGVIAKKDSGIRGFADLADKTTSVNAVSTQGDLTIKQSAALEGADANSLKFSEMPFADMEAQLERGNVDAIWVPEPFLTKALTDKDNVLVGYPNQEALPGLTTTATFTSGAFADANPELVADFKAALTETLTSAQENPDKIRSILPEFLSMDLELAQSMTLENFEGDIDRQIFRDLGDLMLEYGIIEDEPDLDHLVIPQ